MAQHNLARTPYMALLLFILVGRLLYLEADMNEFAFASFFALLYRENLI
jgi:hypothetical protein